MAELIARVSPQIELFLQPVTPLAVPHAEVAVPPSPERVLAWQARLKQVVDRVRVVPQTHKALGQL